MSLQDITNIFSILASLAVILGLPTGLYQLIRTARREQKSNQEAVYDALDEKYIQFQELCMQYPHLDIHDIPDNNRGPLNPQQKKQEMIAFTILLSIFERAYLMYLDQNSQMRETQWIGWENFMRQFYIRENFRETWSIVKLTYETRFVQFLDTLIQEQHSQPDQI